MGGHRDGESGASHRLGLVLQGPLHPPGSFEVAFPAAAEKMKRAILELKKGKTEPLLENAQSWSPGQGNSNSS